MSEANNYYSECNNSPFHLGNCNNNLVTPATPIFASIDDDFSPSPIHTNTVLDFDVEANEHPALHSSQQLNESLAQMNESLAKQLAETTTMMQMMQLQQQQYQQQQQQQQQQYYPQPWYTTPPQYAGNSTQLFPNVKTAFTHMMTPMEINMSLNTPNETSFKLLKVATAAAVRGHIAKFRIYADEKGLLKFAYTIDAFSQARAALMSKLDLTFDQFQEFPEDAQIELLEVAYPIHSKTDLALLNQKIADQPSRLKIATMDDIERANQTWLQLQFTYPCFTTVEIKEQQKAYLKLLPGDVVTLIASDYGVPKTIDQAYSYALLAGHRLVEYLSMQTKEKPSAHWQLKGHPQQEVGSLKAALASGLGFAPFTPKIGSCFQCGQDGHKVGAGECLNPADPKTNCGPCGNETHSCVSLKFCPKRAALDASRGAPRDVSKHSRKVANVATSSPTTLDAALAEVMMLRAQLAEKVRRASIANAVSVSSDNLLVADNAVTAPSSLTHIDSGSNAIFLNSTSHSDSPITKVVGLQEVEAANGTISPIVGTGLILGREALIAPTFTNSLIGVSPFCAPTATSLPNVAIFSPDGMIGVAITAEIRALLDLIESVALRDNLIKLQATQHNGLYSTHIDSLKHLYAGANYYQTAKLNGLGELVQYFHESWGHANEQQMVLIVQHEMFTSLPKELTVNAIHKYFPACSSCVKGNLSVRPSPSNPVERELKTGQEISIDIKHWTQKSFSGDSLSLTATDTHSRFMLGWWLSSKKHLLAKFKELCSIVRGKGYKLECVRVDNAFVTEEIIAWCRDADIEIKPCIPYKHDTTSIVERDHRNLQDGVVTALDQPHLNDKYVAYAYFDVMDKQNMMPSSRNPTTTPQIMWDGHKIDLKDSPILTFGCAVRGHIPLPLQTTKTGRSFDAVYVGRANGYRGGIKLYNTETGRIVIRKDFKVMGPGPCISPILKVPVMYEAIDNEVEDHPSVYGADMGSSVVVSPSLPLPSTLLLESIDLSAIPLSTTPTPTVHFMDSNSNTNENNATNDGAIPEPTECTIKRTDLLYTESVLHCVCCAISISCKSWY